MKSSSEPAKRATAFLFVVKVRIVFMTKQLDGGLCIQRPSLTLDWCKSRYIRESAQELREAIFSLAHWQQTTRCSPVSDRIQTAAQPRTSASGL